MQIPLYGEVSGLHQKARLGIPLSGRIAPYLYFTTLQKSPRLNELKPDGKETTGARSDATYTRDLHARAIHASARHRTSPTRTRHTR